MYSMSCQLSRPLMKPYVTPGSKANNIKIKCYLSFSFYDFMSFITQEYCSLLDRFQIPIVLDILLMFSFHLKRKKKKKLKTQCSQLNIPQEY